MIQTIMGVGRDKKHPQFTLKCKLFHYKENPNNILTLIFS